MILNNNQAGWFTCDNASNNDTCLLVFTNTTNADKETGAKKWDPVEGHVRYDFLSNLNNLWLGLYS